MSHMNVYSQPQYNHHMMTSPMPQGGSQGTPHSGQGPSPDPHMGGSMNTQYSGHSGSADTTRHPSRRPSLQVQNDVNSPVHHSGGATPINQYAARSSQSQSQGQSQKGHGGFPAQPQHPQPGSSQDRGMGRTSLRYDGVNGPLAPVKAENYNPNNQGFNWEAPEGGWPSTMINRPHMQTSQYKNAYSSTGFDMLSVLVCPTCSMLFWQIY